MKKQVAVLVNQIWKDNDKRGPCRYLQVIKVDGSRATCRRMNRQMKACEYPWEPAMGFSSTRIRLDRFRPTTTGYVLVDEGPEGR